MFEPGAYTTETDVYGEDIGRSPRGKNNRDRSRTRSGTSSGFDEGSAPSSRRNSEIAPSLRHEKAQSVRRNSETSSPRPDKSRASADSEWCVRDDQGGPAGKAFESDESKHAVNIPVKASTDTPRGKSKARQTLQRGITRSFEIKPVFRKGQRAMIYGLKKDHEFNGKEVNIDTWDPESKSWWVLMDSGGKQLLRPDNLQTVKQEGEYTKGAINHLQKIGSREVNSVRLERTQLL